MYRGVGGLHLVLSLLVSFHELEVSDDLEYGFSQVGVLILPILLNG